jgi:hypothetical protein
MATTNYALQEDFFKKYPHSANSLTKFLVAMDNAKKHTGKKTLFGKDKGLEAFIEFKKRLNELINSCILDGVITGNEDTDYIRGTVINSVGAAMDVWPNWPVAYAFAEEFFVDEPDVANSTINQVFRP